MCDISRDRMVRAVALCESHRVASTECAWEVILNNHAGSRERPQLRMVVLDDEDIPLRI